MENGSAPSPAVAAVAAEVGAAAASAAAAPAEAARPATGAAGPGTGAAGPGTGAPPPLASAADHDEPLTRQDMDRIMERVEQESSRMGGLVEDMLMLARLDEQRPIERGPVDLLSLAADAVQDARIVAPSRTIDLTVGAGVASSCWATKPGCAR